MDKAWKVISAFVGVFVAGAVFGGLFTFSTANRHFADSAPYSAQTEATQASRPANANAKRPAAAQRINPKMMGQFALRLSLTGEQRAVIRPVIARAEEELHTLRQRNLQDTTVTMDRMFADVTRALTPEQQIELEDMKRKLQERMSEEKKKTQDDAKKSVEEMLAPQKTDASPAVQPIRPPS